MIKGNQHKQMKCDCPNTTFKKVSFGKRSSKKNRKFNKFISWAAGISLFLAYGYGYFYNQPNFESLIHQQLEILETNPIGEQVFEIYKLESEAKYITVGVESGYGGPMVIGPVINQKGEIERIVILDDKETHSFIEKLKHRGFFTQFEGKNLKDPLLLEGDIDAINGATISCAAITKAVNSSAHSFGEKHFGIQYEKVEETWIMTGKDYSAFGIFLLAILAVYSGKKWLRYLSLVVSMVFIGFYFNTAINVSQFGRVMLGFLPVLKSNIFWFVLVFGSMGFAFFLKKNIYCNAMCPFHAVETIMVKIGGMKIRFTPQIQKVSKYSAKFLLWLALMIIFISRNPTLASYEPFAMVFGLEGEGMQWYLLPMVLIGVLLITDYFCRYFCPVGQGFNYIIKFRKWVDSQLIQLRTATLKKTS